MIVFGCFVLLFTIVVGEYQTINLLQGQLFGSTLKSRDGRDFMAFQGIPYAEPPIRDLRFKDPVPAGPWNGVLNATAEPQRCPQKNLLSSNSSNVIMGSEDCLYLNVYVSQISNEIIEELLPVMVWIHGGGFDTGSGGYSLYGPQYFMDEDVIIVAINYRIGPLGFLSTEDDILPGNYGMKDQVLALKWVRDNIVMFGGDPKKVTIFGESAGGASVNLHLLSPLSKGLFHKAIMASGTTSNQRFVSPPGLAKERAEALSTAAGCPKDPIKMAECLKKLPFQKLVDLQYIFIELFIFPSPQFLPVVEKCEPFKNSFLCEYPKEDFQQMSDVPVFMGMNSGEGSTIVSQMYNITGLMYPELKYNFSDYAPIIFLYKYTAKMSDFSIIGEKIFDQYFPDYDDIDDPHKAVKMFNEGYFFYGIIDVAMKLSSKTYFYVYNYVNEYSLSLPHSSLPYKLGTSHGDDLISLFVRVGIPPLKGEDIKISKLLVKIWTRFASRDEFTIDGTDDGQPWPIFDDKDLKYVTIQSSDLVISERPYIDSYEFWNELPMYSRLNECRDPEF